MKPFFGMKAERFVGKTKKHTGFKAEDVKEQIPKEIDNTPLQNDDGAKK